MGQCDHCGKDQIGLQLCNGCIGLYEQAIRQGKKFAPDYFNEMSGGSVYKIIGKKK